MADLQWNKEFALEQTAGDEELLDELLTLFKESAAGDYAHLQQAAAANDPGGVVRAAHSLKGASASLGIEAIRELAMAMEADARAGSVVKAQEKLPALGELLEELNRI